MTASKAMTDKGQSVFMVVGTVLWGSYMACGINQLMEVLVPQHTRQAAFSLFVGLRAENSLKDADFFRIHAEALQPRTYLGWLALGTSLLLASSGTAAACAALLATAFTVLNLILFAVIICGIASGFVLGSISIMMLICACVAGATSLAGASVYMSGATAVKIARWTHDLIVGPVSYNQKAQTNEASAEQPSDSRSVSETQKTAAASERQATSDQMHSSQADKESQSSELAPSQQQSIDSNGAKKGVPTKNGRFYGITDEDRRPATVSNSTPVSQTQSETPSAASSASTTSAVKLPLVSEGLVKQDPGFQFATAELAGQKAVRTPATRRSSSQGQPDNGGL